jgi:formate hydrogenlyase subunit 3/multisubunit Na+/H+ antiporter MnhD subunit
MISILIALGLLTAGGFGALLCRRAPALAAGLGQGSAVAAAVLGLSGAVSALVNPDPVRVVQIAWSVPYGSFALGVDALSAFFLLPVFLLTGLAAVYGHRYLSDPHYKSRLGGHWAFFNLLAASMVMVLLARNAMLFLVAWELMALSSFFLVTMDHDRESVQRAGWIYLVSTHLGTMALFFFFILLGEQAGSLDFNGFAAAGSAPGSQATLLFVLALVGFGSKAGLIPLHVWLPEAHPAAPSHVSAVMSGVMIKTGIYGILRALTWLGPPLTGWAVTLIAIGGLSGVLGILLALAQKDLKRVLAYSSVENIGIIFLGLGIGVLGQATGMPVLAILGFGGALLHCLNHALFKGLLFLGAGSVLHGAQTLNMEQTGGLFKRMPWTGMTFLLGSAAICGLPPLNGFISEFMIYAGAFRGMLALGSFDAIPAILTILALALIGGLAAFCFTRVFGVVFLGEPRSTQAAGAHESHAAMRWPLLVLAGLCILVGAVAPLCFAALQPVINRIAPLSAADGMAALDFIDLPLTLIVGVSLVLFMVIAALVWLRRTRPVGPPQPDVGTWDCGYLDPTPRMQYTATSFSQPLIELVSGVIRPRERLHKPEGFFPASGSYASDTPDVVEKSGWTPLFKSAEWLLQRFRWIQTGSIHLYILYIAITLIVLLIWKLR